MRALPVSKYVVAITLLLLSSLSLAQLPLKYVAGQHYTVLDNPLKVAGDDKIEVMEVFWYGCGHCKTFEPVIASWKKTIADDVAFMRTPAAWRKHMEDHAALYYSAVALGAPNEIHDDLFKLLVKSPSLTNKKSFAKVFAERGVSEEEFLKVFESFGIKAKVKQGIKRTQRNYKVQGTPELIVNGKYRVSGRQAGSQVQMLAIVDFLVDLERSAAK